MQYISHANKEVIAGATSNDWVNVTSLDKLGMQAKNSVQKIL